MSCINCRKGNVLFLDIQLATTKKSVTFICHRSAEFAISYVDVGSVHVCPGTPRWRAREVIIGQANYDTAADVYVGGLYMIHKTLSKCNYNLINSDILG